MMDIADNEEGRVLFWIDDVLRNGYSHDDL